MNIGIDHIEIKIILTGILILLGIAGIIAIPTLSILSNWIIWTKHFKVHGILSIMPFINLSIASERLFGYDHELKFFLLYCPIYNTFFIFKWRTTFAKSLNHKPITGVISVILPTVIFKYWAISKKTKYIGPTG